MDGRRGGGGIAAAHSRDNLEAKAADLRIGATRREPPDLCAVAAHPEPDHVGGERGERLGHPSPPGLRLPGQCGMLARLRTQDGAGAGASWAHPVGIRKEEKGCLCLGSPSKPQLPLLPKADGSASPFPAPVPDLPSPFWSPSHLPIPPSSIWSRSPLPPFILLI